MSQFVVKYLYTYDATNLPKCREILLRNNFIMFISAPCQTLTPPTGGSVSLATDGYQTNATYTCDLGYTLNGFEIITCMSDGTWNLSQPHCGKYCS